MTRFIEYLHQAGGFEAARFAVRLLETFDLPVPQSGEFYATDPDSLNLHKGLLFLDRHDIAFRFYQRYDIPMHDNILQPLFKGFAGDMHYDIVPLFQTGISDEDCEKLIDTLGRDGILWGDSRAYNAGYLPGLDHTVVFDVCRSISNEGTWQRLTENVFCPVQKSLYAPLIEAAKTCFAEGHLPAAPKAKEFLAACAAFKALHNPVRSFLQDSFRKVNDAGQTEQAMNAATAYAARISARRPRSTGLGCAATRRFG